MHNMNGLEGRFTGFLHLGRMKLLVLVVLALFLVCTAPVVCLTGEEAIDMAIAAEDTVQGMTSATQDDINAVAGQADEFDTGGIVPQQSTQIIGGVEYTVYEYTDPVTGEALTQVKDSDGNIIRSEYRDPESNTVLTAEYENGQVVSNTLVNEETGESTKLDYDETGAVTESEYYDPEVGATLTTEYENGRVASETLLTIGDGKMESTTIEYKEDGSKTYKTVDYTESIDNAVVTTVVAGGDIANPDDIEGQTLETQPGIPPGTSWCDVTGQYEFSG